MNIIAANPFFSSYLQSDGFGKAIFWGLFLLSLTSWTILIYKVYLTYKVKKACLHFEKSFTTKKEQPLQLHIEPSNDFAIMNPYLEIYKMLKQKTLQILNKNRTNVSTTVYLSLADLQLIESHLSCVISSQLKWLEKHLFILPTIVTLGPFLGLLGTVWGILITFSELNAKTLGNANSSLLTGLSMALATTVLGLLVAIPALVAHNYLKNVNKELRKEMEHFSVGLLASVEMHYRKADL